MKGWRRWAECARRDIDTKLFFPDEEGTVDFSVIQACRECSVIMHCRNYALAMEATITKDAPRAGIWGGMTPRQRTNLVHRGSTTTIFSHDSTSYKRAIRLVERKGKARKRRDSSQPSGVRSR